MGKMLVDQFSVDSFDKSKYRDKFVDKLNTAVETKLSGREITAVPVKENLGMTDSLRASLAAMGVPASKIDAMIAKAEAESAASKAVVSKDTVAPPKKNRKKAANS
jgi:non-homologous end joining protein Ku